MNKQEILKEAIKDVKKSIARIEANKEKLSDDKILQAIKEFDDFDVIMRKFWIF